MRLLSDVASRVHDPYLAHAAALAERGRGCTFPNPAVGCVIVSRGEIVGEGFHPAAGEPHAEIFALAEAGPRARDADVYVTLEPCAHHGRTPPCTEALVEAGVRRVVVGMADPSSEAGGGADRLRAAGIDVEFVQDATPFAELNAGWLKRVATGLPLVVAKIALSLDGHGSFRPGRRAAITGLWGAEITRRLRSRADAVLVGAATVIADDPALTVRSGDGLSEERQPLRVVLVGQHVPVGDSQVFSDGLAPTLVLAGDRAPRDPLDQLSGVSDIEMFSAADGVEGALRALGRRGINEVLVEPGPRLFTTLWEHRLIDVLVTVVAGGMAGVDSPTMYAGVRDGRDGRDGRQGELGHPMAPVEASIVGDVAVTVWCPSGTDPVQ